MRLLVYPLMKTSQGLLPGQFEVAVVTRLDGQVHVECPNAELRDKLEMLFSSPLPVRRPAAEALGAVAFRVCELLPESEEHFQAVVHTLHRHGLAGRFADQVS
ncbi:MAG: hypothetical protein ACYCW6_26900 [Candidatus Xenobia bacterium]